MKVNKLILGSVALIVILITALTLKAKSKFGHVRIFGSDPNATPIITCTASTCVTASTVCDVSCHTLAHKVKILPDLYKDPHCTEVITGCQHATN